MEYKNRVGFPIRELHKNLKKMCINLGVDNRVGVSNI